MLSMLAGCFALPTQGGQGATLIFRKVFKSSYPEFTEIKVSEDGSGTWDIRQLDEEASPQAFQMSHPLAAKLFELAGQLHNFQHVELDVHRRIANLGEKTLRYEKGGEAYEASFNYTLNSAATQLQAIFEGLARQEEDRQELQRAMRYDRLGVNKVLVHVEGDVNSGALPEPERLLPALDQLASDEHLLDMARQRARALAERIRDRR